MKNRDDMVDLSSRAELIRDLKEAIRRLPDVRTDKVREISDRIKAGTYVIDPVKVAGKMVDGIEWPR